MDNGRLNFKATIDDNDFNRKLDGMKKGVNGLNEALNKNLSNQTSLINKNNNAFLEQRKLLNELKQSLSKATDKTEIARYEKSIVDATNALRKLNEEAKKTPKTAPLVGGGVSGGALPNPAIIGATATATDKATRSFGGLFKTIASSFGIMSAFYAVMGAISGAFRQIVEFDKAMVNMSAIAGQSRKELKDLEVEIRNVAKGSLNTATQVAEMATELIRLGTTPEGVKALLKPVNDLSIATGLAADKTAILVKGTLNAFQEGEGAATRYADVIAASLNLTALDATKFGDAFKYIGATASVAGYSIEETAAMVGVLVDNNVQASSAGRILSSVFGRMAKSGKDFEAELEKVRTSQDQLGQASRVFGAEGARLAVILANNKTRLAELTSELKNSAGSLDALTKKQLTSVSAQFQIMSSAWTEFILSLDSGNGIISTAAKGFSEFGTNVLQAFTSVTQLSDSLKEEQLGLNMLVGQLTTSNIGNSERLRLLTELKKNYPDFVALIGEENLTNQNLISTLEKVNENYRERIAMQMQVEQEQAILSSREKATRGVLVAEQNLFEKLNQINIQYNLGLNITKDNLQETANKVRDLAKENRMMQWDIRGLSRFQKDLVNLGNNLNNINNLYSEFRKNNTAPVFSAGETIPESKRQSLEDRRAAEFEAKKQKEAQESRAKSIGTETKVKDLTKERLSFLDQVAKVERELNQSVLTGREEAMAKISNKYDDLIKKAEDLGLKEKEITKINELRAKETAITTYRADTTDLVTSLEAQKSDYEAFEEYKKKVGVQKATEMYSSIIDVSKNYQQVLQDELASFYGKDLTDVEKERVNELFNLLQNYSIAKVESERKSLEELMALTITDQERILVIQEEYAEKRKQAESITNESIRNERLAILNKQEKEATSVIEDSIYQRGLKERQLIKELTTYTKKELKNRLKSTEEFLNLAGDNLSLDQKKSIESEVELLNLIIGTTDQISRQNALLEEKRRITNDIKNNTSKEPETAKKLNKELEVVNGLINDNNKALLDKADIINMSVSGANSLADAFGGANNELKSVVSTMGNLIKSLESEDLTGSIMGVFNWLLEGSKTVFLRDYEKESQRNRDRLQNQAEYNKMLRDQLLVEVSLNDAYQSRLQIIKEQTEAMQQNKEAIVNQMKELLNRLYAATLSPSTVLASVKTAWDVLGLDKYFEDGVELSDELLNKLAELNAASPLTGSMKDLYDQLMRLKEEYGSIDEMVRQAEKEAKDRLTGTTAQSLADGILQGLANGKRSLEDFAGDMENILRNAILAGLETTVFAKQIQELQDLLAEIMKDGITEEERKQFEEAYAKIIEEAGAYIDLINQAGINIGGLDDFGAGASDGIKRITETQADRLTGILTGMQVDVIESRKSLQISNNLLSSSLDNLIAIEFNTRATADNTYQMVQILQNNQQKALGL